jgi:hypothetical protein
MIILILILRDVRSRPDLAHRVAPANACHVPPCLSRKPLPTGSICSLRNCPLVHGFRARSPQCEAADHNAPAAPPILSVADGLRSAWSDCSLRPQPEERSSENLWCIDECGTSARAWSLTTRFAARSDADDHSCFSFRAQPATSPQRTSPGASARYSRRRMMCRGLWRHLLSCRQGHGTQCGARSPPIAFDRTMTTQLVICAKTLSFFSHWASAEIDFGGFHPMFPLKQPESTRGSPACR